MSDSPSKPASGKTVYVKSYGCQMNVYDSQRMADVMGGAGYREVASPEAADLILLNTCHIREKAAEKVYSEIGRLRVLREEARAAGRDITIGVAGCVAQAEGREILRRAPVVDLVVGPQSYHRLPSLVERAQALSGFPSSRGLVDTEFPADTKFDHLPGASEAATRQRGPSAFLTIQEGCDKFCTFCVVPYTRGAEVSRPVAAVLAEARALLAQGVMEITLLGQNVNAYHGEGEDGREWSLARLIEALAGLPGLKRLRYTTSHPREMSDDLIAAHRDHPALMPYLHLPVQSGSDRILAAMNRKHTRDDYFRIIDKVRQAAPDIALSSDFIVGFPGETEEDFADTLDLIDRVGFLSAFSFKYSPRPGTPAADSADQVPEPVKSERLQRLQGRIEAQQAAFLNAQVGGAIDVLFERKGRLPGQIQGRAPFLTPVVVAGPSSWIGMIGLVRITHAGVNSLKGELIEARRAAE